MTESEMKNELKSLEGRVKKLEKKFKKEEKARESLKKNFRLFLQRMRAELSFKF